MCDWKGTNFDKPYTHAVFDDFPADRLKSTYKQFMGCQNEFTVTDKYLKKVTIKNWSIPSIYLFNDQEFNLLSSTLDWDWVRENVIIIRVPNRLY